MTMWFNGALPIVITSRVNSCVTRSASSRVTIKQAILASYEFPPSTPAVGLSCFLTGDQTPSRSAAREGNTSFQVCSTETTESSFPERANEGNCFYELAAARIARFVSIGVFTCSLRGFLLAVKAFSYESVRFSLQARPTGISSC